jgi:hypothetical protein
MPSVDYFLSLIFSIIFFSTVEVIPWVYLAKYRYNKLWLSAIKNANVFFIKICESKTIHNIGAIDFFSKKTL